MAKQTPTAVPDPGPAPSDEVGPEKSEVGDRNGGGADPGAGPPAAPDVEVPRVAPEREAPEPDGEDSTEASMETLRAQLEEARGRAEASQEETLRAIAALDNFRKRSVREVESAHRYGLERFMTELLPIRDSLELGLAVAHTEEGDATKVAEGIELTSKMLVSAMDKFGLGVVDPLGEAFDPKLHQAISIAESEDSDSGTVIAVVQKGYVLNERLVRPAMVVVAK